VGIAAQPFQLRGDDDGRVRRHVPDLLLLHRSGAATVVDVKPRDRFDDSQVAAVFAWTERVVASRGWAFEAWSGADAAVSCGLPAQVGDLSSAVADRVGGG
jgi:hypothetical protein